MANIDVLTSRDINEQSESSDYDSYDESNDTSKFGQNTHEQVFSISRSRD